MIQHFLQLIQLFQQLIMFLLQKQTTLISQEIGFMLMLQLQKQTEIQQLSEYTIQQENGTQQFIRLLKIQLIGQI